MNKEFFKKAVSLQAIILFLFFGFIQDAFAIYRDTETFTSNIISASSLDAEIVSSNGELQLPNIAQNMIEGDSVSRVGKIENIGMSDFLYGVKFIKTSGDDNLCDVLHLDAKKDGVSIYDGNLGDFDINIEEALIFEESNDWEFVITAPNGVPVDKNCEFDFKYTAWQTDFENPNQSGWVDTEKLDNNKIHTGIKNPEQTGFNENDENDANSYATPQNPNELACVGGITNINGVSVHWTDVANGNENVKYQRQYKVGAGNWRGNEIYTNPYTNYRSFGGGNGNEEIYGSRVRAWVDANGNNAVDEGEIVSDWSNECFIQFDKTAPATPTGLQRIAPNEGDKIYNCGDVSVVQKMWPDWDDNTEDDFDHYEYTSFNAPNGAIGLNEKIFYNSIFKYNGSWLPQNGIYGFAVRAVDKAGNKSEWALSGKTLEGSCQISYDGTAPVVKIITPGEDNFLSGKVKINGTVTDDHPNHYWLVIQDKNGHKVAGPGTVYDSNSFANEFLYKWDTTKVFDGKYLIKLEARDTLGNKEPNEAPVYDDPKKNDDSVDWITVIVDNTPPKITDKFFEVATKKKENSSPSNPYINATITWITDEPATSAVEWGITKSYGNIAKLPEDVVVNKTNHKVIIKNISTLTSQNYHFRIKTVDRSGNITYSNDQLIKIKGKNYIDNNDGDIVLNEFIPNPDGDDNAHKPRGEWIELYNKSDKEVDLKNWFLADGGWHIYQTSPFCHRLNISSTNTSTGKTKIGPKEHLVVYKDGNKGRGGFGLNNKGDKLMLIEKITKIIVTYGWRGQEHKKVITYYKIRDKYDYNKKDVKKGKSFARFPDGGSVWIDPKVTPGNNNELSKKELEYFRKYAIDKCFKKNRLKKDTNDDLCNGDFVMFLGIVKNINNRKILLKQFIDNKKQYKSSEKISIVSNDNLINKDDENKNNEEEKKNAVVKKKNDKVVKDDKQIKKAESIIIKKEKKNNTIKSDEVNLNKRKLEGEKEIVKKETGDKIIKEKAKDEKLKDENNKKEISLEN